MEQITNVAPQDFTIRDIFDAGESSYRVSIDDIIFNLSNPAAGVIFDFVCFTLDADIHNVIGFSTDISSASATLQHEDFDFYLSLVCDMDDSDALFAYIYTNIVDKPIK